MKRHVRQQTLFGEPERVRGLHVLATGEVVDLDGNVIDVQAAVDALRWRTPLASSGSPHQYTVFRQDGPPMAFDTLGTVITRHPESFMAYHLGYQKPMRYWEFGDWRYWRTAAGNQGGVTHMLNRSRPANDMPGGCRRVDEGAKADPDWGGPPWLPKNSPWPPGWVLGPGGGPHNSGHVYREHLDPRRDYHCEGCGRAFFWDPGRPCPKCATPAVEEPWW